MRSEGYGSVCVCVVCWVLGEEKEDRLWEACANLWLPSGPRYASLTVDSLLYTLLGGLYWAAMSYYSTFCAILYICKGTKVMEVIGNMEFGFGTEFPKGEVGLLL